MNQTIANRLKIIVRDDYYDQESFIRHGPLRHMEQKFEDSVSSYPWRVYSDLGIVKSTALPHVANIKAELVDRLSKMSATELFSLTNKRHEMIVTFWIIHVLRGAILKEIVDSLGHFGITKNSDDVHKFLYCMRVAEWIDEKKYGHPIYYYAKVDQDPFEYAFNDGAIFKDALRWKSVISEKMNERDLKRPTPVLNLIGT